MKLNIKLASVCTVIAIIIELFLEMATIKKSVLKAPQVVVAVMVRQIRQAVAAQGMKDESKRSKTELY